MNCFRGKPERTYITVSVDNLEQSVTVDRLKQFFTDKLPDCDPVVKPFVRNGIKKATTVIYKGGTKRQCEDAAREMDGTPLVDDEGVVSRVSVKVSFEGLTTLCETSDTSTFE